MKKRGVEEIERRAKYHSKLAAKTALKGNLPGVISFQWLLPHQMLPVLAVPPVLSPERAYYLLPSTTGSICVLLYTWGVYYQYTCMFPPKRFLVWSLLLGASANPTDGDSCSAEDINTVLVHPEKKTDMSKTWNLTVTPISNNLEFFCLFFLHPIYYLRPSILSPS